MATFYSGNILRGEQARAGNEITAAYAAYIVPAGLATNDVIQMIKVPKDARVLETLLTTVASVAATASLTVGDGGDTDRFITATSYAPAGVVTRMNSGQGNAFRYTDDDTIDITCASIATPVAGTVIVLNVIYTMQF